jgi:hypothetical protein
MVARYTSLASGRHSWPKHQVRTNFVHSGAKLGSGQSIVFPALLTSPDQCINCYVMCDGIGRVEMSHSVAATNFA